MFVMLIHTLRANIFKTEAKLEEIGEHARVISVVKLTCKNIKLYTDGRWGLLRPFDRFYVEYVMKCRMKLYTGR